MRGAGGLGRGRACLGRATRASLCSGLGSTRGSLGRGRGGRRGGRRGSWRRGRRRSLRWRSRILCSGFVLVCQHLGSGMSSQSLCIGVRISHGSYLGGSGLQDGWLVAAGWFSVRPGRTHRVRRKPDATMPIFHHSWVHRNPVAWQAPEQARPRVREQDLQWI